MADKANQSLQTNIELVELAEKQYLELYNQLNKNVEQMKQLATSTSDLNKQLKSASSIKAYNDQQKQLKDNIKRTAEAERETIKTQKEAEKLERERIKTIRAQSQEKARQQRETNKLNSLYKQESARLTKLRNDAKDVALQFGTTSKQFRNAATEVNKLDKELKDIDSRLGQSQRFVGEYQKAWGGIKTILGAAGIAGGFQALFQILKKGVGISTDYEKSNAVLASVLGKTLDQTKALQGESAILGQETAFTASQVTSLQTELARLGKSEEDIIASTEGIINATIALGSETGETAALVGSTLNAFNLSASQSGKVADVLTLSTQKSALSFEKLNTALPQVSGAAAAVGISLEEVVAQLGAAADRGIDASTAGTSLRNIYLKLSESGQTLDEAINQINNSTDKAAEANKLFGVRAVTTALAIANNTDKTKELTKAYQNAGGTAKRVADTQLDTLDGKTKLLNSAFEGLILNVFNTDGAFGELSGTVLTLATALLSTLNALFDTSDALTDVEEGLNNVKDLYDSEKELLEDSEEARQKLILSLQAEGLSYRAAKEEADKYLTTLEFINSELGKDIEKQTNIALLKTEISLLEQSGAQTDVLFNKKQQLRELEDELRISKIKLNEATDEELQEYLKLQDSLLQLSNAEEKFLDAVRAEIALRSENADGGGEEIKVKKDLIEIQKELLEQAKELPGTTEAEVEARNLKIKAIEEEIARLRALGEIEAPDEIKIPKIKIDDASDLDKEIEKLDQQELDRYLAKEEEKTKILEDAEKQRLDLRKQFQEEAISAVTELANIGFENQLQKLDDETDAITKFYDDRLTAEELDDEQRKLIEAERDKRLNEQAKKQKEIEKKQFLFNQGLKLAEIAIETAKGVATATAQAPATFGASLAFIPLIVGTGAAQAAVVAAQTIPQLDKGSDSTPDTYIAGEKRTEIRKDKMGNLSLITQPTLFTNDKGSQIIGGAETANILDNISRTEVLRGVDENKTRSEQAMLNFAADLLVNQSKKDTDRIIKAINKPKRESGLDRMRKTRDLISKHSE